MKVLTEPQRKSYSGNTWWEVKVEYDDGSMNYLTFDSKEKCPKMDMNQFRIPHPHPAADYNRYAKPGYGDIYPPISTTFPKCSQEINAFEAKDVPDLQMYLREKISDFLRKQDDILKVVLVDIGIIDGDECKEEVTSKVVESQIELVIRESQGETWNHRNYTISTGGVVRATWSTYLYNIENVKYYTGEEDE